MKTDTGPLLRLQKVGFQDRMVSAKGCGDDVRNCLQAVAAIREDHQAASSLARSDYKGLKPGIIFTMQEKDIVIGLFQRNTKPPGKGGGILDGNGGTQHLGDGRFVNVLRWRGCEKSLDELRIISKAGVKRCCRGRACVPVGVDWQPRPVVTRRQGCGKFVAPDETAVGHAEGAEQVPVEEILEWLSCDVLDNVL